MLDLKFIREDAAAVKACLANKGANIDIDSLLAIDEERRRIIFQVEELKAAKNRASKQIGQLKAAGKPADEAIAAMQTTSQQITDLETTLREREDQIQEFLWEIPNIHHPSVPVGPDDSANVEIRRWGEMPSFDFTPQPHWEIGEKLGILKLDQAAKISGARFSVLAGAGARLERALISFMIDLHVQEHGYTEIFPPFLVRTESMAGTGQLPKFAEDAFHCEKDDLWLIPTAEVPVTNLHRDEILTAEELPIKYVAYSACFRREAGAAGRDTRGIIRVHQFDKVEMVKFTTEESSYDELQSLLGNAEDVLQRLGLHYRVSQMCTGDLGFTAAMKFDPEVWCPGQDRFVEISSCSNFEAFQARRANIRYRPEAGAKPKYAHTLNGSGLAVGRTFVAILENYQQQDGSVRIPPALVPYMGGQEIIEPC